MSKNGNYWNFSKSKGHNSAENYSTGPIIELNLRILVTHLCTHLHNVKVLCLAPRHKPLTTLADIFRADLVYFDWMRIEHS